MIRILSADLLVADIIVTPAPGVAEKFGLLPGGKAALTKEQFDALSKAVAGCSVRVSPGGSSANMLTTLGKLLGKEVEIRFLGIAGASTHGGIIRASLEEAGIALLPEKQPPGAEAAISYVLMFADGQRAIATWPGNARDRLKPEMITEEVVRESDALLVQGSLWHKFGATLPDRMLELCRKYKKELWLTLPTQAAFGAEDAAHCRGIIPEAALVLGNDSELMRVFGAPFEASLGQLRKILSKEQVGFITCGERGAAVVTAAAIDMIPPVKVEKIVNTLGAGDTAFAGFAAGYLKGRSHVESARWAELLAAEKLKVDGPRLNVIPNLFRDPR